LVRHIYLVRCYTWLDEPYRHITTIHTITPTSFLPYSTLFRSVAGQGLVDGVVHDLVDQVVQATLAGGADIHARPLADRLQPFEEDRKSTRLNSSHVSFSYAVLCF